MFSLCMGSCNIVHVYLRTMVDVCCLISVPLSIPVNEFNLVDYCVLCSNSYLTQVQCSATLEFSISLLLKVGEHGNPQVINCSSSLFRDLIPYISFEVCAVACGE